MAAARVCVTFSDVGFRVGEVSADKAYAGTPNFNAVEEASGTFYPSFKPNTTGGVGGLFEKMFHYFCLNVEEYLTHYHRRSNVESTVSMVKRKFGDTVFSKSEVAGRNEMLCKLIDHNICCLVAASYELGINPVFWPGQDDGPRDILRFPSAGG